MENEEEQEQEEVTVDERHHNNLTERDDGEYEEEDTQVVQDSARQQMTESEIKDERLGNVDKVYLMPKQVQNNNYMLEQSTSSHMKMAETHDKNLEIKHLESNKKYVKGRDLKNSLLSSNMEDNTLYDLDKDTVYSFFAEESEIRPRAQRRGKSGRTIDDVQASFIASRSPKEYKRKKSGWGNNARHQVEDEDSDDLAKTKTKLKYEKRINREQADMLKHMQAQIDMLTHKWSITENQLRNNGAIYSVMQPAGGFNQASMWHPTATNLTHNLTQRALNPNACYSVLGGAPQ